MNDRIDADASANDVAAEGFSRRSVLGAGALALAGAAASAVPVLWLAQPGQAAAQTAPRTDDKFMRASNLLIQHRLSPAVGARMAQILRGKLPSFDADLDTIIRVAQTRDAHAVEDFFDALPAGRVTETAHQIIFGWYAGTIDDNPASEVFAYEEALMYQSTRDAIALPTYAFNGPNHWTEVNPPLAPMPDF